MFATAKDNDALVLQNALHDDELHKALLDQLDEGIYMVDRDRRILYWNRGAERMTGYLAHEVAGQFCHGDLLMHCDPSGAVLCGRACPLTAVLEDGKRRECTVFLRHKEGHRIPVRVQSRPICDLTGAVIGAVEVFEEARQHCGTDPAVLQACGCLDEMTGAANRRYGEMRMLHALEAFQKFGIPFGWLRIELDGMEDHLHRYGHGMGDAAARIVARTLEGNVGPLDLLSYWGRGEFRLEVHGSWHEALAELADKLVVLVRASKLEWWGDSIRITVSIGGVTAQRGDSRESLELRLAETFENCRAAGGNRASVASNEGVRRLGDALGGR